MHVFEEKLVFLQGLNGLYKDKVQQELLEELRVESRLLLQADADARRTIAREDIKAMVRLKIELERFKYFYYRISGTCGSIDAIEEYLRNIELKVKKISYKKNNIK